MAERIGALHHVTAFAGDPARNLDFYARVLGLRLVKRTVNFDDPGTWHLYYGDQEGTPGSILTFFPIPGMPTGGAAPARRPRRRSACPLPRFPSGVTTLRARASPSRKPAPASARR
jgi:catechol 2,3-dioxygenase-like lactoylglutathione lyase family enzyme